MRLLLAVILLALVGCNDSDDFELPDSPKVADPLLIDVTWTPSTPNASQTATIQVTIKNQGGLASRDTELELEVLYDPRGSRTPLQMFRLAVPGLAAQQAINVATEYHFGNGAGEYGVRLRLDPDDLLDENIEGWDGETNNVYDRNEVRDRQGRVTLSPDEGNVIVLAPTKPAPLAGG